MCGRYDNLIPRDAYAALFRPVRVPRLNFPPRYNVAPTDQIPIVRVDPRDGERELTLKPKRKLLRETPNRFKVELRVEATDGAGNSDTVRKTIKVTS